LKPQILAAARTEPPGTAIFAGWIDRTPAYASVTAFLEIKRLAVS
jgi:hypothetical protein